MKKKLSFTLVVMVCMLFFLGGLNTNSLVRMNTKAAGSASRVENDATWTWNCITFGSYWQNDTNGDGVVNTSDSKEPIKWRILSSSGNTVLLLADQNLDAGAYHNTKDSVNWENCQLRTWLNQTFYENAFTELERKAILESTIVTKGDFLLETDDITTTDKIYIPSLEDITQSSYGFLCGNVTDDARVVSNTNYTGTKQGMYTGGSADVYWLRNVGQNGDIMTVVTEGQYDYHTPAYYLGAGIRPMLQLDISDTSLWNIAQSVSVQKIARIGEPNPILDTDESHNTQAIVTTEQPAVSTTQTANAAGTDTSANNTNVTESDKSKVTSETVSVTNPAKVTILSLWKVKKKQVKVSWMKVSSASGYQLVYTTDKKFQSGKKTINISGGSKTSKIIKKLKVGKKYYVKVRAYKYVNGQKLYGAWSKKMSKKITNLTIDF